MRWDRISSHLGVKVTDAVRSKIMRANRAKDTCPKISLRKALHAPRRSLIPWPAIRCATACRFPAGVTTSFPRNPSAPHCRASYRPAAVQAGVLLLKPLQTLGLADIHAAIRGLPLLHGRISDAVLAAQIGHENPGVMLQNADDLIFGEPAAHDLWSFRWGQSLPSNWIRWRGQRQEEDRVFLSIKNPYE